MMEISTIYRIKDDESKKKGDQEYINDKVTHLPYMMVKV